MTEIRPYSNQMMKLISQRLKRAARHLSPHLTYAERVQMIVEYVQQQGLHPWDFGGDAGEDALIAIAQALPPRTIGIDTETAGLVPNTLVVDSLSREYAVSKKMQLFQLYGGKPRARAVKPFTMISATWKRVLQHALGQPE
jgi:hypothetical protein